MIDPSEVTAARKFVKERKKNVFEKIGKYFLRKSPHLMKFLSLEKQIREQLEVGVSKRTIWLFLTEEKIIDFSYAMFCKYLQETDTNVEQTSIAEKKIKTKQEDTATQTKEVQKPEEIQPVEAELQNQTPQEAPETTQVVEGEKSETLKRIEEHRQRVQAQRAAEATTETKPEQQIETNVQQDTQETEEREFGKLPKGKVWNELSEELKETIRSERRQLDAEEREKRKQQQIEAAVAEREASKLHHNPNT